MRLFRMFLTLALFASSSLAQQPAPLQQNWFPQAVEGFGQTATSRTEFSFDHSMLVMAARSDEDASGLQRVIAGINGISVHRFKFEAPGMFDPRILGDIRHEYNMAGWQHIGNAHDKYGYPQGADVWLHLEHNTIRNIAVLFTGANQVNFLSVSGSISPIDLLRLSGHLGIPRIQGGVTVAGPGSVPAPQPNYGGPQYGSRPPQDENYGGPQDAPPPQDAAPRGN
jgi:hypothetical protein